MKCFVTIIDCRRNSSSQANVVLYFPNRKHWRLLMSKVLSLPRKSMLTFCHCRHAARPLEITVLMSTVLKGLMRYLKNSNLGWLQTLLSRVTQWTQSLKCVAAFRCAKSRQTMVAYDQYFRWLRNYLCCISSCDLRGHSFLNLYFYSCILFLQVYKPNQLN